MDESSFHTWCCVTIRDKARKCQIRKTLNDDPHLRNERSYSYIGLAMCPQCPTKDWRDNTAGYIHVFWIVCRIFIEKGDIEMPNRDRDFKHTVV